MNNLILINYNVYPIKNTKDNKIYVFIKKKLTTN